MKRYPKTLSSGANNTVIALSESESGKIFDKKTRLDIGAEAEKMRFANGINGLVVEFIRFDFFDENSELLVMNRLYPYDFRAFETEKRFAFLDKFEKELYQLHENGFVHRHLRRAAELGGQPFDNIFLTPTGIRLIDVGISVMKSKVSERLFSRFVEEELTELEVFRKHFLSR